MKRQVDRSRKGERQKIDRLLHWLKFAVQPSLSSDNLSISLRKKLFVPASRRLNVHFDNLQKKAQRNRRSSRLKRAWILKIFANFCNFSKEKEVTCLSISILKSNFLQDYHNFTLFQTANQILISSS